MLFRSRQTLVPFQRRQLSVNRERVERKLTPLKWDEGLARAARKHAEQMAEHDLLEHQVPGEADLATRAQEEGASFSHITENIAMGVSADKFHDGWMHSPGHRANILDAESDSIGIAIAENETESPWTPLHVERGFKKEQSTVTVMAAEGPHQFYNQLSSTAKGVLTSLCDDMKHHGSTNGQPQYVVALAGEHMRTIAKDGWSKADIQDRKSVV